MYLYVDVRRENIFPSSVFDFSSNTFSLFSCIFRTFESHFTEESRIPVLRVCRVLCDPTTHKHTVLRSTTCQLPREPNDPHPPRINPTPSEQQNSVEPKPRTYPSTVVPGRPHTPGPQRSPQMEDSNLQLILARHSQGQPLPQCQEPPRNPA